MDLPVASSQPVSLSLRSCSISTELLTFGKVSHPERPTSSMRFWPPRDVSLFRIFRLRISALTCNGPLCLAARCEIKAHVERLPLGPILESRNGLLDDLVRIRRVTPALDLHLFAFKILVGREEVNDLFQLMRMNLLIAVNVEITGIRASHRQNLLVTFAVVDHIHQANRSDGLNATRETGCVHEHEDVQRIAVIPQRRGNKAIVAWIMHRRIQVPVQPENKQLLVIPKLRHAIEWNPDHYVYFMRSLGSYGQFQIIGHFLSTSAFC